MHPPSTLFPDKKRFFDGGDDTEPENLSKPPSYEFVRADLGGQERFRLLRRVGYLARHPHGQRFVVPEDLQRWTTDFASVPWFFAWLVPKSGSHLPAALIHDGLVGHPPNYRGPHVTRDEADLVLREAMADLGTGVVRRWLIWTAVTLRTIFFRQVGGGSVAAWYYFTVECATLGIIFWLGTQATLDVLAVGRDYPGIFELPWMRSSSFWIDIGQGAAGAVIVPVLLGLMWGRFWRAGVIAGVAFAFLLHVTLIILWLTTVYWVLEKLGSVRQGRVLFLFLVALGLFCFVVFVRSIG